MKFTRIAAEPTDGGQTFTVTAVFEVDGQADTLEVPDVLNPNHPQANDGDYRNAERAAVTRLESLLSKRFEVTPDEVKRAAEQYFGLHKLMPGRA